MFVLQDCGSVLYGSVLYCTTLQVELLEMELLEAYEIYEMLQCSDGIEVDHDGEHPMDLLELDMLDLLEMLNDLSSHQWSYPNIFPWVVSLGVWEYYLR